MPATMRWLALALLGILIAAAISIAASRLASQQIGLASQPISAGDALAPSAKEETRGSGAVRHRTGEAKTRRTAPGKAPAGTTTPPTPTTPTTKSQLSPAPTVPTSPSHVGTASPRSDSAAPQQTAPTTSAPEAQSPATAPEAPTDASPGGEAPEPEAGADD